MAINILSPDWMKGHGFAIVNVADEDVGDAVYPGHARVDGRGHDVVAQRLRNVGKFKN